MNYFDDLILSLEHLTDIIGIETLNNWYYKFLSMEMKTCFWLLDETLCKKKAWCVRSSTQTISGVILNK